MKNDLINDIQELFDQVPEAFGKPATEKEMVNFYGEKWSSIFMDWKF